MVAEKKKPRVMDSPIYMQFTDSIGFKWFVIEEKGFDGAKVTDEFVEELGGPESEVFDEEKSGKDIVRVLDLPPLGNDYERSCFAVANSRIFLVGGYYETRERDMRGLWITTPAKWNGIRYIDIEEEKVNREWKIITFEGKEEWERIKGDCDFYMNMAVVPSGSDWIYCVGQMGLFKFNCNDVNLAVKEGLGPPYGHANILAATETKIFMLFYNRDNEIGKGVLGYYDMISKCFNVVNESVRWPHPLLGPAVVVVRDHDEYLITYGSHHPITQRFEQALYVYDIKGAKWLCEVREGLKGTVQGLEGDGITFPRTFKREYEDFEDVYVDNASVVLVQRDELKLALVWTTLANHPYLQTHIHWSKFKLSIQGGGDDDNNNNNNPPIFRGEAYSLGSRYTAHFHSLIHTTSAG